MSKVLVIDDDRSVHYLVKTALESLPVDVWVARDAREGLEFIKQGPDLILLDIILPDLSGLEAARKIQALDAKLPVIFITGHGTSETAIEAMKLGAYDYLLKPLDLTKLKEHVQRALEIRRLMNIPVQLPREPVRPGRKDELVGRSSQMQQVYKAIGRVAPQDVSVLICGESGSGKELVARAIYQHSNRAAGRFLAVNCAAAPDSVLESELFGHEKGSSAATEQRRIGTIEQCSGGTLFLDEICQISPVVQARLLRVLQEGVFERVGGTQLIKANLRTITATKVDLKEMVAEGSFREDLYYRLAGFTIEIPPLRERGEDILMLLQHFLRCLNSELGKEVHGISPEALDLMMQYPWPGNVRELEGVLRQSLLQTNGTVILPDFLPDAVLTAAPIQSSNGAARDPSADLEGFLEHCLRSGSHELYPEVLQMAQRYVLTRVLRHTGGNQSQAAKLLGITRGSLRGKIRALGITLGANVSITEDTAQGRPAKNQPTGRVKA